MIQLRLILGGALVLGAFAVITVVSFYDNRQAYYTVDELVADPALYDSGAPASAAAAPAAAEGPRMVVRGDIDRPSVERSADGLALALTIRGKDHALPVRYQGLVPDTFERATEITVGGRLAPGGVFVADQLSVQCPAKYEALPPGEAGPAGAAGATGG
jgi:cytochrome c-type biogenesis protein CcmE